MQDSAKLGERVAYVLKARYPSSTDIVFPDSTFGFRDMAFLEKQTFTSFTKDSVTIDSAVYYLSNFSLDSVKTYALPVFEILKYDSLIHYAPQDELALRLTIDPLPEELVFKENNRYLPIRKDFNYPILLSVLGGLLIIALAVVIIFGKKIKRNWAIRKLKKRHRIFHQKWESAVKNLQESPSLELADELLWHWKDYLEQLTGKPYREWTSTEIARHLDQPELITNLRQIELIIYANRGAEDLNSTCQKLKRVCEDIYHQKIKEIHERK